MSRIIPRSEWGAKYRDGFGNRTLPAKHVFLHHSVTPSAGVNATLAADIKSIQTIERVGYQRFGGISYTYMITEAGRIFQGHSPGRIGAHTAGYNTTGIAISFVGNYENLPLNKEQEKALIWLLQLLRQRGELVNSVQLKGHYQVKATACPGKNIKAALPRLEADSRGGAPYLAPKAKAPAPKRVVLRMGSRGAVVKELQTLLNKNGANLKVDGVFGRRTKAAVINYQARKRLTKDGIVGKNTWGALLS